MSYEPHNSSVDNISTITPDFAVTSNGTTALVIPDGIPETFALGMAELELDKKRDST